MSKRGPYRKGIERKEEILRRALEVIAEEGYESASVTRIAEAVGLSKTGLLHHFGTREQLLTEVLRKRDELDDLGEFAPGAPPEELKTAYLSVVERNASIPGLVELFTQLSVEAVNPDHPAHEYFVTRDEQVISRVVEAMLDWLPPELAKELPPRALALILLSVTDGIQQRWLRDSQVDMTEALETLFRVFNYILESRRSPDK